MKIELKSRLHPHKSVLVSAKLEGAGLPFLTNALQQFDCFALPRFSNGNCHCRLLPCILSKVYWV